MCANLHRGTFQELQCFHQPLSVATVCGLKIGNKYNMLYPTAVSLMARTHKLVVEWVNLQLSLARIVLVLTPVPC